MYCADSVRALGFSATSNTGDSFCTAVWGKTMTAARNFVATYDDVIGLDRPLSLSYAESEGITVASSAAFYTDSVNGKTGNWGAIMPNTNKNGIRRVVSYDFKTARELYANTDADGVWGPGSKNTVDPKGGLTSPVNLGLDDAALTSPLLEFWARTSNTNENSGQTEVYVTRKYSNDANQSVRLYIAGGDAVKNTDYTITEQRQLPSHRVARPPIPPKSPSQTTICRKTLKQSFFVWISHPIARLVLKWPIPLTLRMMIFPTSCSVQPKLS
jgi:hypothetical protein